MYKGDCVLMDPNVPRDFTKADQFSDVTMIVEGTKLYVHRQLLAEWSGVWRRLFLSEMTGEESMSLEFVLEDEKLEEIVELLQCIYSTQKPISEDNVKLLLKFSEEYEMVSLRSRCEEYLLGQDNSLETLLLAEKYKLRNLYKRCIQSAKTRTLEDIERSDEYKHISQDTLLKIYKEKIEVMRDYANDLKLGEKKLKQQNDRLNAEKEGMLNMFQNIPKVWEEPSKRCYKHVTEDNFDYTCRDCNEKVQREVRRMCHDGQHVRRFYKPNRNLRQLVSSPGSHVSQDFL